jgi:acylphosphatase
MTAQRERRTIHFAGHVQGVGFRYTAASIAQGHAVKGFVQNLPDGRVLLVAEGTPATVDAYLAELQSRMEGHIGRMTAEITSPTDEFDRFDIRH